MSGLPRVLSNQLSRSSLSSNVWGTLCPIWRRAVASSTTGGSGKDEGTSKDQDESSSGGNKRSDSKPEEESEDDGGMFGMDDFMTADTAEINEEPIEDISKTLTDLEAQDDNITPEMASELVSKIVQSASTSLSSTSLAGSAMTSSSSPSASPLVLPHISAHTISVLKACRIESNHVMASATSLNEYVYPIARKVVGYLDMSLIELSKPARKALVILAGKQRIDYQRVPLKRRSTWLEPFERIDFEKEADEDANFADRDDINIKVSCNKFPTRQENKAWVISRLHYLVAEAKKAVGEPVDDKPLAEWSDIEAEVKTQASEQVEQVGGDVKHLLGLKS